MALGVLGFLLGLVPGLRTAGLACAGTGLVLAGWAVGWLILRPRPGGGFALAAFIVSLQALGLALPALLAPVPAGPAPGPPEPPPSPPPAESSRSLPALVARLHGDDPHERAEAAGRLAELSGGVLAAVPDLTDGLTDADPEVRIAAANALGAVGPWAKGAIPALLQAEKGDTAPEVQQAARAALDRVGRRPAGGDVPVLLVGLQAPRAPRFRAASAQVLWMIGNARPADARPAVPALGQALRDEDVTVRLYAAQALYAIDRHPELVVTVFQETLHHPDPALRTAAAQALAGIGPAAKDATPDLEKALETERDGGVRLALGEALWFVDAQADPLLTVLHEALRDPDPDRRDAAAEIAGQVGDKLGLGAPGLVPDLVKVLKGEGPSTLRARAAHALGRLGPPARPAAPDLGEALKDPDPTVRHHAAVALIRLGPGAADAVPALIATLQNKDDALLRAQAAAGLEAAGNRATQAVGPLVEALEDPDKAVRARAAAALGAIGTGGREVVVALSKRLKDPDKAVRGYAAQALWAVDRQAPVAILTLVDLLHSDDADQRLFAAQALAKMKRDAKVAYRALHDAGNDPDDRVREAIDDALTQVGPPAEADVGLLTRALTSDEPRYRVDAAQVLALVGPGAKAAVPTLCAALRDKDPDLRAAAAEALGKIGPEAGDAVGDLRDALGKAREVNVRVAAAEALGTAGERTPATVDALTAALKDQEARVRAATALSLAALAPQEKEALNAQDRQALKDAAGALVGLVEKDADPNVHVFAAYAVVRLNSNLKGWATKEILKTLTDPKLDRDPDLRALAATTLGGIKANTAEVRQALEKAAQDPSDKVRSAAADALKELGH
jgi:HEAT repeat protein